MDIVVGLLLLVLGAVVTVAGLRVFFIVLPIWGFLAGFFVGASLVQNIAGDAFLATVASWLVGLLVGVVFALLSYLYWYVGAILAAASAGALLVSGLLGLIGITTGWVIALFAIIGAFIAAFIAFVIALPVYMVAVSTAFSGAATVVAAFLLLFDQVALGDLGYGAAWTAISHSWFWAIIWTVLAVAGILAQTRAIRTMRLPTYRWRRAERPHREEWAR